MHEITKVLVNVVCCVFQVLDRGMGRRMFHKCMQ